MKRTTIMLPDQLAALVDNERRKRDVSAATIIREVLEQHFFNGRSRDLGFIGIADSGGIGPSAAEDEAFLAEHWADDIARDRDDHVELDEDMPNRRSA